MLIAFKVFQVNFAIEEIPLKYILMNLTLLRPCQDVEDYNVDDLPPLMLGLEMSPADASPGRGAGGKTPRATRIEFLFYYIL